MTPTGFLTLATALLILFAWRQLFASWRMKFRRGLMRLSKRGMRSYPSPYEAWLSACGTQQTASAEVTIQLIKRRDMSDLYVAGFNGKSVAFYNVEQLEEWLSRHGVSIDDPVWEYIANLVQETD